MKEAQKDVFFDEKTEEHYKLIKYREGLDNDAPNKYYTQVFDDNQRYTFESDIYSQEFFDFIKEILVNVSSYAEDESLNQVRTHTMEVAHKAVFKILARCFYNSGIKEIVTIMIDIFAKDDKLVRDFVKSLLDANNAKVVMECLLDCDDACTRINVGHLIKYLLCRLKEIERDQLLSGEKETIKETVFDKVADKEVALELERPVSVAARFINHMVSLFNNWVAKQWKRFDCYNDILLSFGIHSSEEVRSSGNGITLVDKWSASSDACRVGLEYFFQINMVERLGDFILEDESPLLAEGEKRPTMDGSAYMKPNFAQLMQILTIMVSDKDLVAKYPLTEVSSQMM